MYEKIISNADLRLGWIKFGASRPISTPLHKVKRVRLEKYEIWIHLPDDDEQTISMRKRRDKGLTLRGILFVNYSLFV